MKELAESWWRKLAFIKIWSPPCQTVLEDQTESQTAQNPIFYSIFRVFHEFKVFSQIEIEKHLKYLKNKFAANVVSVSRTPYSYTF